MSSSEAESSAKEKTPIKLSKFQLKKLKEIEELQHEDVLAYIEKLHELLRKKEKKLKKYKEKIKALRKQVEQADNKLKMTKTEVVPPVTDAPNSAAVDSETTADAVEKEATEENHASAVCNFVNDIRQAAEQAQNLNGFVYEPTSGLYYDQKTGYYYNAEYGLYYDGNTGSYYHYNQEKNVFEFHSQVQQVQRSQKTPNDVGVGDNDDDRNNNDDDDDADADDNEIEFDEWGVITDKDKLHQIREEKRKAQRAHTTHKKKSQLSKRHKSERKSKKRKRSRHDTDSDSATHSENSDKAGSSKSRSKKKPHDVEDGELSSSCGDSGSNSDSYSDSNNNGTNSDSAQDDETGNVPKFSGGSRFQDIAKKYPPSLRIIVQETNLDTIKVGSLSLITFKGGSLGREGNHDVIIPDVNVSKTHLKFSYDHNKCIYKCIDVGSRNGTILNGARMSVTKTESTAHDLVHGSVILIGQTKLLCHVHKGNSTCGLCEPGLLIETARETVTPAAPAVMLTHKEQLKMLQKKYGLENEKFVDNKQTASNYNDRAATRRVQIGSTTDGEKTQTASVNTEISSENKGFKMLAKLGWNRGEALGKANDGTALLEPIKVTSNEGKKGLGCDQPCGVSIGLSNADKRKIATWKKTQQRYQKTDIFEDSDSST